MVDSVAQTNPMHTTEEECQGEIIESAANKVGYLVTYRPGLP